MNDYGLSKTDLYSKNVGRQAYADGMAQAKLKGTMERAGWLDAALRDPDSMMCRTDAQVIEGIQIRLKANARIPRKKGNMGRPKGSKDSTKRKKRKIFL